MVGVIFFKIKNQDDQEWFKDWHKEHCQNMGAKILEAKEDLNTLQIKNAYSSLSEEETQLKRDTTVKKFIHIL